MGAKETELTTIIGQGQWDAPHLKELRVALDILNGTMALLSESPGWEGTAADAAGEKWVNIKKAFDKVADAVTDVEKYNTLANQSFDRAASAIGALPAGKVPGWLHDTVKAAEVGSKVFIPAMGISVLASSAVNAFEGFLGSKREEEANQALITLEQELDHYSEQLKAADFNTDLWKVPEPQPQPVPTPGPTGPGVNPGGSGGGYSPRAGGSYTPGPRLGLDGLNPPYTGRPYPYPVDGSNPPSTGTPYRPPVGDPNPLHTGGPYPPDQPRHNPSVDDGSGGVLPGHNTQGSGMGGRGGYGGGSSNGANSGLNAAVMGGGTAAGATALRFGTGGAMGGGLGTGGLGTGGLGTGGLGTGGLGTGGVTGSGGLLGTGAAGAGGSGAGASGTAGTSGGRGMMGGQSMGGGGNASKKDKRSGLGGHIAPKIEDDEPDFIPLPDGARAGGRDQD